jgi:peptidoglycan/LPS O-acetylase OafA/YrhL
VAYTGFMLGVCALLLPLSYLSFTLFEMPARKWVIAALDDPISRRAVA